MRRVNREPRIALIQCKAKPNISIRIDFPENIILLEGKKTYFSEKEFTEIKKWFDTKKDPWVSLSLDNGRIDFMREQILYYNGKDSTTIAITRDMVGFVLSTLLHAWQSGQPQDFEVVLN